MLEEHLNAAIGKFNKAVEEDPKLKAEVTGKVKTILLLIEDGPSYHFVLENGHIDGVLEGGIKDADVIVTSDMETMVGIFSGEVSALRAYALKKLRLKASLQDLMTLRKFF
jgi:putative sterol carrier protein